MGGPPYPEVVDKLITLLTNEGRYDDLTTAVEQAVEADITEMKRLGIFDRESFLDYIDDLVTTWVPSEDMQGKDVLYRVVIFYFIFSQKALEGLQTPIDPSSSGEDLSPLSNWLVEYAKELGSQTDQEGSLTARSLQTFHDSDCYNMNDYIVPRGGWRTFNDFFARNVKPGYRPIACLCDSTVIVSPADATFDETSLPVSASSKVTIKCIEWDIHDLLQGSKYADDFKDGRFMHMFLNTTDYHRQHTPVDGTVLETLVIPGQAYLEVVVKVDPKTGKRELVGQRSVYGKHKHSHKDSDKDSHKHGHKDSDKVEADLNAPDSAGYQFLQCRGLVVIENTIIGKVAILPIGMAQVSSVIITAEEGRELRKGEEISYFQFGGSDVVLVFQKEANVVFDHDPLPGEQAKEPKHYNMGEQIGTANPAPKAKPDFK